jgi:hypothetical protein
VTEERIVEYEKTLKIPYAYEVKLIALHNRMLNEICRIYSELTPETKMKICKFMKKTRLFNHYFMEQLIYDVQV